MLIVRARKTSDQTGKDISVLFTGLTDAASDDLGQAERSWHRDTPASGAVHCIFGNRGMAAHANCRPPR